ncbi:MAG TPA: hypothetical protein VKE40_01015 [Gemmataceae bacterium]|nr:hypothetical protein [Gemmataceae bacterium]
MTVERPDEPDEMREPSGSAPMIAALVGGAILCAGTVGAIGYLGCQAWKNAAEHRAEAAAVEAEQAARDKQVPAPKAER